MFTMISSLQHQPWQSRSTQHCNQCTLLFVLFLTLCMPWQSIWSCGWSISVYSDEMKNRHLSRRRLLWTINRLILPVIWPPAPVINLSSVPRLLLSRLCFCWGANTPRFWRQLVFVVQCCRRRWPSWCFFDVVASCCIITNIVIPSCCGVVVTASDMMLTLLDQLRSFFDVGTASLWTGLVSVKKRRDANEPSARWQWWRGRHQFKYDQEMWASTASHTAMYVLFLWCSMTMWSTTTQHLVLTSPCHFCFLLGLRVSCWWLFFGCCSCCPCRAIATRLLLVFPCYDAAPCRRFGGDFIVAVVFVLTDPGCVHLDHGASRVHHDCDITIVMNNVIREILMALT